MIWEFSITDLTRTENKRSRPRSRVTLATIDTSTAGRTATKVNSATIWTCSRAAARPRLRACTTFQISRTMMATSIRMVPALIARKVFTTLSVARIGVSSVRITNVRQAESSAMPTANGTSSRRSDQPRGSVNDGSNVGADVSALVISRACGANNTFG